MTFTLLSHQWKAFWRGRGVGKSLALQLFLGFIFLYLLATCLVLGIELSHFLRQLYPGQDIIKIYCGLILYYFAIDIVLRFVIQELPVLSTQPYLIQNIRRRQLVTFLNIRSLFHFLNLVPIFIFLPFVFADIAPAYGITAALAFTVSILCLTGFNHFGMLYMMRKAYFNTRWLAVLVALILVFVGLQYFRLFSFGAVSSLLFLTMLRNPWLALIPLSMFVLAFENNRRFLLRNLYIEELAKKTGGRRSAEYAWLQQWGLTGELTALDIRLILRNKRPRSAAAISLIFLCYGLIFYQARYLHPFNHTIVLFVGLFMTGLFEISFGRFAFAWQSGSFDGLLALNLPISDYIRAKFLLFNWACTIAFVITSAYGFIDWHIILIQAAAYIYNIGFNSVLTIWFATYSYKAIDLSKGSSFNYQGSGGAAGFLYSLLVLLPPIVVGGLFKLFGYPWIGIVIVGAVGLISLLFRKWWIEFLTHQFYKRKYLILQGFREK
jgi:uncharacterized protein DUF5687